MITSIGGAFLRRFLLLPRHIRQNFTLTTKRLLSFRCELCHVVWEKLLVSHFYWNGSGHLSEPSLVFTPHFLHPSTANRFSARLLARPNSTWRRSYQHGAVHDLTAALHTFRCCHPLWSHDLPSQNHSERGRKHQRPPPGRSQRSDLKRVIICLPLMRGNDIPLAPGVKSLLRITGYYPPEYFRGFKANVFLGSFTKYEH